MAIIGLGCVALRSANATWVASMFGLTWLALAASLLLAFYRDGQARAFWIGFAVIGWLHLLLLMYGWSLHPETYKWSTPLRPDELITTRISHKAHDWMYPQVMVPVVYGGMGGSMGGMAMGGGGDGSMGGYSEGMAGPGGSMPGGGGMPGMGSMMGGSGTVSVPSPGPSQQDFTNVAHALWTLLLAIAGGQFGKWLFATRDRRS